MSENFGQYGEIKYVAVARVNDATLLLSLPSTTTKRAYADEVIYYICF